MGIPFYARICKWIVSLDQQHSILDVAHSGMFPVGSSSSLVGHWASVEWSRYSSFRGEQRRGVRKEFTFSRSQHKALRPLSPRYNSFPCFSPQYEPLQPKSQKLQFSQGTFPEPQQSWVSPRLFSPRAMVPSLRKAIPLPLSTPATSRIPLSLTPREKSE
jgi:hypothetical protein